MTGAQQIQILLVDDCGHDSESLRKSFSQAGLSSVVHVVSDGEAALTFLRQQSNGSRLLPPPSLILLDMNSERNGEPAVTAELELLGELKGDPALRPIPVIVVTESRDEADILNAYSSGACSFVSKPSSPLDRQELFTQLADYWANVAQLPRTTGPSNELYAAFFEVAASNNVPDPIPILIVDDNEDDVLLLKEAFSDCPQIDFIASVEDGESALRYLRGEAPYAQARRPALILLDINMPRMNGFEVLAELRSDQSLSGTPVVMLTTSKRESDILQAYSDGACSFISKPVNFDRMRQIAQRFASYWAVVANTPSVDTALTN